MRFGLALAGGHVASVLCGSCLSLRLVAVVRCADPLQHDQSVVVAASEVVALGAGCGAADASVITPLAHTIGARLDLGSALGPVRW